MTKYVNSNSSRLAFILTECFIGGFMTFRLFDIAASGDARVFVVAVIGILSLMLIAALLHRLRRFLDESFWMPMLLYVAYIVISAFMGSFFYFLHTALSICCVGALFFNYRSLGRFVITSNVISLLMIYSGLLFRHPVKVLLPSEMMMQWFITLLGSVFIYMVTAFASDKNVAANKASNSFASLLKTTPNRIILMDPQNRVTYISKSFMQTIGVEKIQRVIGLPVFDIFKDTALWDLFYDILTRKGSYQTTQEIILDGRQYYFEINVLNLTDDVQGRLVHITDITPVMEAKIEAEEASKSKSAFLATMSHEIRTPLNAIIGLSEIELQKKLPMETRLDLEKIHTSGGSLLSIINDILDISKIEAGSFALVPADYDTPSMMNDTIHLNVVRIGSKNIIFKLEIDDTLPIRLLGDEMRVKQVLNNLLSNAFKYTDEGTVILRVVWERRGNDAWITFTISDTGRGMRKEDIPRLFVEYSQLDTRANRHIEGTGLGLSITKNLVELMGGTIGVESEYGKGSSFTVQIPQTIVDDQPIGEMTAKNLQLFRFTDTRRGRGLDLVRAYMPYGRVLVVDDVETNLDVARGLLLPYGLSIDCAGSGQEAIDKIRAVGMNISHPPYDMVLMDHMMPKMDGVEAVRIIRSEIDSDYARTVPIVALTANALAGNEAMFLASGFNAFISKPIDIMQLDMALNTWVKNKQNKETLLQAEMDKTVRGGDKSRDLPSVLDGLWVDGIDLVKGRERYTSETAYLDILRSYYVHTPPLLEKLRSFSPTPSRPVLKKDLSGFEDKTGITLSEYTVTVHGLKGSSYGICADSVGKEAENLERAAREGDLGRIKTGNIPFIEKAELLLADLGELLKKTAAGKEDKQKVPAPSKETLEKLLDAVRHYRTSAMEEILSELESFEYETGNDLVTWLREQMDNLEYEAITNRLESGEA